MDVVSLAAAGFPNAVAPLGTALTEAQARLIRRYAPRALLLYDSDRAGLKATFRSGDILLAAGVEPLVVTLPEGEDPDTLVRSQGPDALRRHMDGSSRSWRSGTTSPHSTGNGMRWTGCFPP